MKRLVLFASGKGSNVRNIIEHFEHSSVQVVAVFANKKDAGALSIAREYDISAVFFEKADFLDGGSVHSQLKELRPDLIVLAGFLWLVPAYLVQDFPNKIVNVHPALLPRFGGKGMYGKHVHRAVVEAKVHQTGITIHYVNEQYDEGAVIARYCCNVLPEDTADDVERKVRALEQEHFPKTLEILLTHA